MSHLDTAYQLGVKQAEVDFQAELDKIAQGRVPGAAVPGAPTVPTPINPQVGKGIHGKPQPPAMPVQQRTKSAQGDRPLLGGGTAPPVPGRGAQPVPAPPPQTQQLTPPPSATRLPGRTPSVPPPMPTRAI
jgi:hypothetical protein